MESHSCLNSVDTLPKIKSQLFHFFSRLNLSLPQLSSVCNGENDNTNPLWFLQGLNELLYEKFLD